MHSIPFVLALAGCITSPGTAASPDGTGDDVPRARAEPELVDVTHDREVRAAWIATVANINFPSRPGLTTAELGAELVRIVDAAAEAHLNTLFFQVRPEGDAMYDSELEPWSRFLTGTQGQNPGFDPLMFLIDEAHARNVEIHAWLNPYRARSTASATSVAPHLSIEFPEYTYRYGDLVWMDPGAPQVQDRVVDVVVDLVSRYDLDGIHLDDYFYPYPNGTPFPDDATFSAYTASGGTLDRADWRRDNVNQLVRRLSQAITETDAEVRFGISPFGIYRPGQPEGVTGLDQYEAIYADPLHWVKEGWVDYLAPQLYWPTSSNRQAFGALVAWWAQQPQHGELIVAGCYASQLGSSPDWTLEELRTQALLAREQSVHGHAWFNADPILNDRHGFAALLRDEVYPTTASTPPLADLAGTDLAAPLVEADGYEVTLMHVDRVRSWGVYRPLGDGWELDRLIPGNVQQVALEGGKWAVSAVSRGGVESRGVVVAVP